MTHHIDSDWQQVIIQIITKHSEMPPQNLLLKIVSPIMLLQNLEAPRLQRHTTQRKKSHASRYRGHHPDRLREG